MAQAVVRFLAQQRIGARRPRAAVLRRRVRHLRARQRRRHRRRRCRQQRSAMPLLPGAQRAGDGAHRGRLRQDAATGCDARLHLVDRPGRDQHDHRRGAAPRSTACRCCCCRATSSPRRNVGAGAAAARVERTRRTSRSTTASSRCRATGTASTGRSRSSPSLPEAMRVLTSPAETGAVTLALPQDVQAEAYDYPGGAVRAAGLDDRRARARSRRAAARPRD